MEVRLDPEAAEQGDRAEGGLDAGDVVGPGDGAADLQGVAADADLVDVGEVAELAADLGEQVRLDVLGPPLVAQGVRAVGVGDGNSRRSTTSRTPGVCWAARKASIAS